VGAAALLCSGVAVAALPRGVRPEQAEEVQWRALAIAPLARGGDNGLRMDAGPAAIPIQQVPHRRMLRLQLTSAGEPAGLTLTRAGVAYEDAIRAGAWIGPLSAGTRLHLIAGPNGASGRALNVLEVAPSIDLRIRISRTADGTLQLSRERIAVDQTPLRIRGQAGNGLYWSLRAAGASPQTAAEYLRAIGAQIDVGSDVGSNDAFDLVIASRAAPDGSRVFGPLLYAGIKRLGAQPIQLVRWGRGATAQWVDAASLDRPAPQGAGMASPVAGRITSTFGWRRHPILGFGRLHKGVDFGAAWGSPIVAAASGQVSAAGWAGGHGRQVRVSHGNGVVTTYSHMSSIAAEPGAFVRQGQVIGYVGSSGLSTGAHLHYEVHVSGQAVDPLSVRLAAAAPVARGDAQAIKARLQALLAVGTRRV
jgi:murein DD-endopeptidase MepM/ murein hydrolase activator NlpD